MIDAGATTVLILCCFKFFRPKAELSVGARALAKHHHRDQSESWWGNCTGSRYTGTKISFAYICSY